MRMKALLLVVFSGLMAIALCQDPRTQSFSQCMALNDRNCTMNQTCVERRDAERAVHLCIDRIMRDQACMTLNINEEREAISRLRPTSGTFSRDVTSRIDGRMPMECSTSLVCRNNTCQDMLNTACNIQRSRNSQVCCDEDGRFDVRQCRRMADEISLERPTALVCGCANRITGQMSNRRTVRTRDELPNCGRNCSFIRNRRNVSVRHGESISRPLGENRCVACRCNNGDLDQCRMVPNTTCAASQRQASRTCRSDGKDFQDGEEKNDGACNRCRCVRGEIKCTDLPGCQPNKEDQEKDEDLENHRMECSACMDMPFNPVCVPRQGRTFPTQCHAMRCANVSREHIMPGACRDNDPCTSNPCAGLQRCFRTGSKTQMSSRRDGSEARRECVDLSSLNCVTTRTKSGTMERLIERSSSCNRDEDMLPRNMDTTKTYDEERVVCGNSGMTFPSTCHLLVESSRSDNQVRHPGQCRNIDQSEMVCGTDGVTYSSMDIMQTQGGNVRMDYKGACMNASNANENTVRNRCEMARKNNRCPSLQNCTSRSNTSDGCCSICGGVMGIAFNQDNVEDQADTLPDLDALTGRMLPLLHPNATRMCNISITKPINAVGDVAEMVFQARDMSMGMYCRMHAMNLADRFNKAGDNTNNEPITVAEDVVAAAAVAPQLEETSSGSIPFVASPILMLCLTLLLKVVF